MEKSLVSTKLGFPLRGNQLAMAFAAFKTRADAIGILNDDELVRLLAPFATPCLQPEPRHEAVG